MESLTSLSYDRSQQEAPTQAQGVSARSVTTLFLVIYETVVATLAGTYITPESNLDCRLQDRWRSLFQQRDSHRIRTIQDALDCCGLRSTKDMAFPFPASGKDPEMCRLTYGRSQNCMGRWRAEEQKIAAILLVVDVLIVLWQVAILFGRAPKIPTWLVRLLRTRRREGDPEHQSQRVIDYQRVNGRYSDEPEAEDEGIVEEIRQGRILGNSHAENEGSSSRVQPLQLHDTEDPWGGR
jgi:hypothetical protein